MYRVFHVRRSRACERYLGAGSAGRRHRRSVFRDIGTQAWYDYLGWANPTAFEHEIEFGRADLKAGSDRLIDPKADFTKLKLSEMSNLHVHWGTDTAESMK